MLPPIFCEDIVATFPHLLPDIRKMSKIRKNAEITSNCITGLGRYIENVAMYCWYPYYQYRIVSMFWVLFFHSVSLVAKNRQSILVAIFLHLSREISRDLTDVPPAQRPLPPSLAECSVCPLCFAPLAAVHTDSAAGRPTPTRRRYQHNVLWSAPPVRRGVGNTVNTWGDYRRNGRARNPKLS